MKVVAVASAWRDLEGLMAKWERRLEREGLGVVGMVAGTHIRDADAVADRMTGSVWELGASVDHLLAALHRYRFQARIDRRICEMLSRRVPWWRIARDCGCSKRRVSQVSQQIRAWRDPESAGNDP